MMPNNRISHSMASVGEFLVIYGGYDFIANTELNELWIYNTLTGTWKRYETPIDIKNTCLCSSICTIGNLVYFFGGDCIDDCDIRGTNSLVSFDLSNETWERVSPYTYDHDHNTPPPMCICLLFYHNGSLYVLGTVDEEQNTQEMFKFCLQTYTWSLVRQIGEKPTFINHVFGTVYKNQ